MISVSADLAAHPTPLEYWFFKVHSGDLAFLVDFIVRRRTGQAELRVSLWVRGKGRVARGFADAWHTDNGITIAENVLDSRHSAGAVDDIEWNLTYEVLQGRAAPSALFVNRLHPFDLEVVSRPRVAFSGHVMVAGERFELADAAGSLSHYWGRRLADRWHWIHANSFEGTDLTVEATVLWTRLWGRRPRLFGGYVWTYQDGRERLVVSPLTGLVTLKGTLHDYRLVARGLGGATRLHCVATPDRYNDLGEGIAQTLFGSCAVGNTVDVRAGVEYRVPPGS
jgi:hypothetical protein